jgi:hypothetical protein
MNSMGMTKQSSILTTPKQLRLSNRTSQQQSFSSSSSTTVSTTEPSNSRAKLPASAGQDEFDVQFDLVRSDIIDKIIYFEWLELILKCCGIG